MADISGFNANDIEPSQPRELIRPGDYPAVIIDSEMVPTSDGLGQMLKFVHEIIDGPYKGRKLTSRHNLVNRSAEAVRIAKQELSAICRAVGVLTPNDSSELHGRVLMIVVGTKKRNDTGEITNEIKGHKPRQQPGTQPAATNGATGTPGPFSRPEGQSAPPAPPPPPQKAPWSR
jgi:hypothetical protein